jgi:hypothetical protein
MAETKNQTENSGPIESSDIDIYQSKFCQTGLIRQAEILKRNLLYQSISLEDIRHQDVSNSMGNP